MEKEEYSTFRIISKDFYEVAYENKKKEIQRKNEVIFILCIFIFLQFIAIIILNAEANAEYYAGDNKRKEVFLRVIHVDSVTSMSASKAYDIYQEVTKYYSKNTAIELHPAGFLSIQDPRPQFSKISDLNFNSRPAKLWFYITRNKLAHKARKREVILIIDKALEQNGLYNLAGGRSNVCSLYCASCYSYMHGNLKASLKVAIHEVGHALGVKGHEANTIMDITIPNLTLGSYAKKRIAGCNRKITKRKIFFCKRRRFKRRCLIRWGIK